MVLLESDPFLLELSRMYERNKTKGGTVRFTMKRSTLRSLSSRRDARCTVANLKSKRRRDPTTEVLRFTCRSGNALVPGVGRR